MTSYADELLAIEPRKMRKFVTLNLKFKPGLAYHTSALNVYMYGLCTCIFR